MTVNQDAQGDADGPWTGLIKLDPWLEPFKNTLKRRYIRAKDWIETIDKHEGGLEKFSRVRKTSSMPWINADVAAD